MDQFQTGSSADINVLCSKQRKIHYENIRGNPEMNRSKFKQKTNQPAPRNCGQY